MSSADKIIHIVAILNLKVYFAIKHIPRIIKIRPTRRLEAYINIIYRENFIKKMNVYGVMDFGVNGGDRTHDPRNHNPMLYQLSYVHHAKDSTSIMVT